MMTLEDCQQKEDAREPPREPLLDQIYFALKPQRLVDRSTEAVVVEETCRMKSLVLCLL